MLGIGTQQQPQAATMLKPLSTTTIIFDSKNDKLELFEDLFHTMFKMQPEVPEAMKFTPASCTFTKGSTANIQKHKCTEEKNS